MVRRGSLFGLLALLLSVVATPITASASSQDGSLANQTLTVSVPGPFSGCSALSPTDNASTLAVLDLVRPSAFQTTAQGNLVGEGGPIASAELTSLQPETVQYTISPNSYWSDGVSFTADDLVSWWMQERTVNSVASVGYRDISNFDVSNGGMTVTATFSKPFADWNSLFRDVEASGAVGGCKISSLVTRPSLGPYEVRSASSSKVVLVENPKWPLDANRFGKVVLVTSPVPLTPSKYFANLYQIATPQTVGATVKSSSVQSRISESSAIEELQFSPQVKSLLVREGLSLSLDRQKMIDNVWGSVTYTPAPGASVLFSQGASNYPGPSGMAPAEQTTTTTTQPSGSGSGVVDDCTKCAAKDLVSAGFVRSAGQWRNIRSEKPLTIQLVIGPGVVDRRVAQEAIAQWRAFGVQVSTSNAPAESAVPTELVSNMFTVGIFARPTTTNVSFSAASWCGATYDDSFPSGFRSAVTSGLCTNAESVFNPVSAQSTWQTFDQDVQQSFWVRPLVAPPVLNDWSPLIAEIASSYQLSGMVDQIPTWTKVPPATSTTQ